MKSRDRTERHAQPCCGAGRGCTLISALAAARSKHSARLQRKLKALGRDLSASRASDVIDKECCYAGVATSASVSVEAAWNASSARRQVLYQGAALLPEPQQGRLRLSSPIPWLFIKLEFQV